MASKEAISALPISMYSSLNYIIINMGIRNTWLQNDCVVVVIVSTVQECFFEL